MAEPITWIDVADSAVKVGLGALIGGGISYLTSWLGHRNEAKREYVKRRMDSIESAFSEIDEFSKSVSWYWCNLINAVYKKSQNNLTEADKKSLKDEEQNLFSCFSTLNSAKTKMILLAESNSAKQIEKYKLTCDEFFKIANIENEHCTEDILGNTRKQ